MVWFDSSEGCVLYRLDGVHRGVSRAEGESGRASSEGARRGWRELCGILAMLQSLVAHAMVVGVGLSTSASKWLPTDIGRGGVGVE